MAASFFREKPLSTFSRRYSIGAGYWEQKAIAYLTFFKNSGKRLKQK